MFITSSLLVDFLLFLTLVIYLCYKYSTRKYDFFEKRNIPFIKPVPIFGSMMPIIKMETTPGEWLRDLYNTIDSPYFGAFMFDEPHLIIKSPEIIKQILIKDFNHFSDRTILAPSHDEVMSNIMFIQKNPEWKLVRRKMSPVFTSGKLRDMSILINDLSTDLIEYIREHSAKLDSKDVAAKFFTDVISKCAFAINANSFKVEDGEMRKISEGFFKFTTRNIIAQNMYFFKPAWANFLKINLFETWIISSLKNIFWQAIELREQTNSKGHDLIDIVIDIRKNEKLRNELQFDGDRAVAQAVMFFVAGSETTSATLSFTLYELCINPEVQEKLREEVVNCINDHGGITYDSLNEMKYMDMCIYETLRKYPAVPFLDRRCNEDCKLVGTDLTVKKGMPIYIPVLGLHYDEKYFPEPQKYIPDRFADKTAYNENGLYYLPFGEGPRICIGERFGMLGVKTGLAHIISGFIIEKVPETPIPVKFEPKSLIMQSTVGLPLKFIEI